MAHEAVLQMVKDLAAAPTVYAGLKDTAEAYLKAVGTADEASAKDKLIAQIEGDVQTVDEVISFFRSDAGIALLGKETADSIANHAEEIKGKGEKYCDCPACSAGLSIIGHKELL